MITELCIDVIDTFKALQKSLEVAIEHICVLDRDLPAWFQEPQNMHLSPLQSTRQKAGALIRQLEYLDQQAPREILVGAGLMAASMETIEALRLLNCAKNDFKQAMLKLKAAKVAPSHEYLAQNFEQLLKQRDPELRASLKRMGMARIHLKQCYRKIPYFLERPNKVSWTWANTRSIKRISVAEAEAMLIKHTQDAGIERQIKLVRGLPAQEKLAIVQELAPHLRANIVFPDSDGSRRLMVKGPVPIFYLIDNDFSLPELVPPGIKRGKDKDRALRKDVKINPEPFLPAIRAYRYYAKCE